VPIHICGAVFSAGPFKPPSLSSTTFFNEKENCWNNGGETKISYTARTRTKAAAIIDGAGKTRLIFYSWLRMREDRARRIKGLNPRAICFVTPPLCSLMVIVSSKTAITIQLLTKHFTADIAAAVFATLADKKRRIIMTYIASIGLLLGTLSLYLSLSLAPPILNQKFLPAISSRSLGYYVSSNQRLKINAAAEFFM